MVQETGKRSPGLSKLAIFGLALLAVPRVVAHDLDLVGPAVNALLVWVPLVIWVTVVLVRRVENPFLTLLAVGLVYGILLAIGHQVFWEESFDNPPALGGNLAGVLSPGTETVVLRGFAFLSSVVTGTAVGAATGAVAWLLSRLRRS